MATGTQVPWTTPGGTPCCCINCADDFSAGYWATGLRTRGAVFNKQYATLIDLTPSEAAEIFAGGTWSLNNYSATGSATATGGATVEIEGGSVSSPISAQLIQPSSCFGAVSFFERGTLGELTLLPYPGGNFPSGTGSARAASGVNLRYEIVQTGPNVFQMFVGIGWFFEYSTFALGPLWDGFTSVVAWSDSLGSTTASVAISVLGANIIAINGGDTAASGQYGINTLSSHTTSASGDITFIPSAP